MEVYQLVRELPHVKMILSSPSDVKPERKGIRLTVDQWNKVHGSNYGVIFEVIGSEDAVPGIAEDAQTVISKQLMKHFDVFVAILWNRIGTPTGRGKSGTIEEYEIAIAKHHKDPSFDDIMVYFKTSAVLPAEIDPEQLKGVNAFKEKVGKEGPFYYEFSDSDEFYKIFESHLTKLAKKFAAKLKSDKKTKKKGQEEKKEPTSEPELETLQPDKIPKDLLPDDDDQGIWDYIETFNNAADELIPIMEELSGQISRVGAETDKTTELLVSLPRDASMQDRKRPIVKLAGKMNECSNSFEASRGTLREIFATMINSTKGIIETAADFTDVEIEELKKTYQEFSTLHESMVASTKGTSSFSRSLNEFPRLEKRFNAARKRLSGFLDDYSSTALSASMLFGESLTALKQHIKYLESAKT